MPSIQTALNVHQQALLLVAALVLSGCAAQFTLIDRTDGNRYAGTTDGTTVSGAGEATIEVEGEKYTGPWIYQPSGGSFGFSNFSSQANLTGTGSSYNPSFGTTNSTLQGRATTSGTGSSFAVSAVGNGMINVRAPSGKFMRCVFSFHTLQNTGIGECLRNDGRTYDLTVKR